MKIRTTLFLSIAGMLLFTSGCKSSVWTITSSRSGHIAIDSTTNRLADKQYEAYIAPYRSKMDKEMNQIIGRTDLTLSAYPPESPLSNWNADVYRKVASVYLKQPVDIAVVNLGGLRTTIPEGNITVRNIFELMPFENELVIVWLKGDKLNELLQFFALKGGEGESGIRMRITTDKKTVDITVNGSPLDPDKTYSIATSNFVAGGNDGMVAIAHYVKRVDTGIKIRNMLMDFVKQETAAGRTIRPELDGRISKD